MKHLQTLFILLSFVAIVFNLQSCRPRDGEDCPVLKDTVYTLSAEDERKIPYIGYDTLYFLNKQGDTCIVRGTGKQYYTEIQSESIRAGCPPQNYTSKSYIIDFQSLKGEFSFLFKVQAGILHRIFLSEKGATTDFRIYLFELQNSTLFYGGVSDITRDTCYTSTYNMRLGVTQIKNCNLNTNYTLIF
jgi:hypothetical protein